MKHVDNKDIPYIKAFKVYFIEEKNNEKFTTPKSSSPHFLSKW